MVLKSVFEVCLSIQRFRGCLPNTIIGSFRDGSARSNDSWFRSRFRISNVVCRCRSSVSCKQDRSALQQRKKEKNTSLSIFLPPQVQTANCHIHSPAMSSIARCMRVARPSALSAFRQTTVARPVSRFSAARAFSATAISTDFPSFPPSLLPLPPLPSRLLDEGDSGPDQAVSSAG